MGSATSRPVDSTRFDTEPLNFSVVCAGSYGSFGSSKGRSSWFVTCYSRILQKSIFTAWIFSCRLRSTVVGSYYVSEEFQDF